MDRENNLIESVFNEYNTYQYNNFCKIPEKIGADWDDEVQKYIPSINWELISENYSEEEYIKNYGNPFSSVEHKRLTLIVGKNNDKLFLKVFLYRRFRKRGQKFFKIETQVKYLTYNFITNSLYHGYIINYHKKRKFHKKITKNGFSLRPLNKIRLAINNFLTDICRKNQSFLFEKNDFVQNIIVTFLKNIPNIILDSNLTYDLILYQHHMKTLGVKLPNNWVAFSFSYPQPKKKDFLKNKMKYIDTIMSIHKLNGDKIKKELHQINIFHDSLVFNWVCKFFGRDFILTRESEIIRKILESNHYIQGPRTSELLSKKEKENAFEIYKLCISGEINITTFYDHIMMVNRLKQLEEIRWNSNTYSEFNEEHYVLSEKMGYYTKGEYRRIYNKEFIQEIEKSLVLDTTYYPVLLTTSKEYNMESLIQSNCVKGYINKPSALIISLRKDSLDSKDRATIEFRVYESNNKIMLRRVQTLGRFNQQLTSEWNNVLYLLDIKIQKIIDDKIFTLPSIEMKIGGRLIQSNSIFKKNDHNGINHEVFLIWENENIESNPSTDYDPHLDYLLNEPF